MDKASIPKHHYFLDEAGDPTFYGKGKNIILGQQGVSLCYILGMIKFENDLNRVREQVKSLQKLVESKAYFHNIGSIKKKKERGGFYFHATDDIPEVRMLFYEFIDTLSCSFEAVVGTKIPGIYIKKHNSNMNEFYADLLSHLFDNKIQNSNKTVLNVAERGTSTRDENLKLGLRKAVERSAKTNKNISVNPYIVFNIQNQTSEPLLNIADYFCWSIQRVFERGEMRYYNFLKNKIISIKDIYNEEGENKNCNPYTMENPLTENNKKSLLST